MMNLLAAKTRLRSALRKTGLLKPISRLRDRFQKLTGATGYEARFERAMLSTIRPGDVVWDVGANVGLYTQKFAQLVGPAGRVVAIEPSPGSFAALSKRCASDENCILLDLALSDEDGAADLALNDDPTGVTHSLSSPSSGNSISVETRKGDSLIEQAVAPVPNIIKIDVEGFEEEAITGLSHTLRDERCRGVFVEVHFSVLDSRGLRDAPIRIDRFLKSAGFDTKWPDSSHLAGIRKPSNKHT